LRHVWEWQQIIKPASLPAFLLLMFYPVKNSCTECAFMRPLSGVLA
jgi:hypothetical protein